MSSVESLPQHQAIYLIGIAPKSFELSGYIDTHLSHAAIEAEFYQDFAYIYRRIERAEFEGPMAERNLQDIHWMTNRIMAHQECVSALAHAFPLYPASFGTLFTNLEKVEELIAGNRQLLSDFFNKIDQRQEWGLKFIANRTAALNAYIAAHETCSADEKQSGANYLKRMQQRRQAEISSKAWVVELVHQQIDLLKPGYPDLILLRKSKRMRQSHRKRPSPAALSFWIEA